MADATLLRRLDRLAWAIIAAVAAAVLLASALTTFRIGWDTFVLPLGAGLGLAAAAWFYRSRRPDPKLAHALDSTGQMVVFSAVGAPLSYLAAAAGFPLLDGWYEAADRAIGVDWRALLATMNTEAAFHPLFSVAYQSFTIQATATVLILAFTRRLRHLKIFTIAFMASALVCIAISALMPAEGIWGHFGLTAADYPAILPVTRELHLPIFHGLRDGSLRELVGMGSEGIITFPSFHAALGVIFIAALWPVPVIRWIGLALNLLMIVATPVDGGHYVVDVAAGIVIALACLAGARALAARMETGLAGDRAAALKLARAAPAE